MSNTYLLGVDGSDNSKRAANHAVERARAMGSAVIAVFVIEWSPYSFQTPEENEVRHQRRESEIEMANKKVLQPLLDDISTQGVKVEGVVKHGNIPQIMLNLAKEHDARGIIIGRLGDGGLSSLLFGSVTSRLVQASDVPVTVVP